MDPDKRCDDLHRRLCRVETLFHDLEGRVVGGGYGTRIANLETFSLDSDELLALERRIESKVDPIKKQLYRIEKRLDELERPIKEKKLMDAVVELAKEYEPLGEHFRQRAAEVAEAYGWSVGEPVEPQQVNCEPAIDSTLLAAAKEMADLRAENARLTQELSDLHSTEFFKNGERMRHGAAAVLKQDLGRLLLDEKARHWLSVVLDSVSRGGRGVGEQMAADELSQWQARLDKFCADHGIEPTDAEDGDPVPIPAGQWRGDMMLDDNGELNLGRYAECFSSAEAPELSEQAVNELRDLMVDPRAFGHEPITAIKTVQANFASDQVRATFSKLLGWRFDLARWRDKHLSPTSTEE